MMRKSLAFGAVITLVLGFSAARPPATGAERAAPARAAPARAVNADGNITPASPEIVVGPFDIHRKYRSMEGPYVIQRLRVSDLIATKRLVIPESMVVFVEGDASRSPSMGGHSTGGPAMGVPAAGAMTSTDRKVPEGLVDTAGQKRELWWFKGIKIEVLDEHDRKLPTAEFICHLNLDVDTAFRKKAFPDAENTGNGRLMTLTQGQTEFHLPDGFGVPVASDEVWSFTFQAANRTTTRHRRLKHICTVWFERDSELKVPIKALHWYNPYVVVAVDNDSPEAREGEQKLAPHCLGISGGDNAPNMVAGSSFKDSLGRRLSGHWAVPPGTHTYRTPIVDERDRGFAGKDRVVHAVFTHVHPTCTESSLVTCDGEKRTKLFTARIKTKTRGGLELEHIDNIVSREGIVIPAGKHYELEATYSNPTSEALDSMVALGIFLADEKFVRPVWPETTARADAASAALPGGGDGLFCGIRNIKDEPKAETKAQPKSPFTDFIPSYPLFSRADDGPLLADAREVEIETSAGKLHLRLDPSLAPVHATQLFRLLNKGVFDGTEIFRYDPGYVLQVSNVETKKAGQPALSGAQLDLLRRLPLELEGGGAHAHKQWSLTMARYDDKTSAVSSFSILLADAPHLDGQYTVFGRLVPDEESLATIRKIQEGWSRSRPFIVRSRAMDRIVSSKR